MTARLHILNKSPDHPRYRRCLEALEAGDALVLMESGVLAVMTEASLASIPESIEVYAIEGDLTACSGTQAPEAGVEIITHAGLIELVWRMGSPLSW